MDRIRINPGDTVPLFFDPHEWRLIFSEAPIPAILKKKLENAAPKKEGMHLPLTLDELDELTEIALVESEQAIEESKRKTWIAIFARMRTILDTYTDGEEELWDEIDESLFDEQEYENVCDYPLDLEKRIEEVIQNSSNKTFDEINEALEKARLDYNRQPQEELGGFSPEHLFHLLNADWSDSNSLIQIQSNLSHEDVCHTTYFQNSQIFLNVLLEEGKTKATVSGNLNRKFVGQMYQKMTIDKEERRITERYNKVLNEFDAMPVHLTRIMLDLAGYIKLRNKWFSITQKGKKVVDPNRAGECFAQIFKVFFQNFNLSYLDGCGDNPSLQSLIAFSFYQLSKHAQDWTPFESLLNRMVLPITIEEAQRTHDISVIQPQIYLRILSPLEKFGLLEMQEDPDGKRFDYKHLNIRKTPLFDRFLQFKGVV
ncbi:MAG: hypothetical protein JXR73_22650 [Candidatus Omnitrophica bacterium]|nr:hypothetical protein [Candidatus Omnitrophota bacterium]